MLLFPPLFIKLHSYVSAVRKDTRSWRSSLHYLKFIFNLKPPNFYLNIQNTFHVFSAFIWSVSVLSSGASFIKQVFMKPDINVGMAGDSPAGHVGVLQFGLWRLFLFNISCVFLLHTPTLCVCLVHWITRLAWFLPSSWLFLTEPSSVLHYWRGNHSLSWI